MVVNKGMESIHFPIKDKWIPNSMPKLMELVEFIISRLKERKTVVVHCNGGKGRSGTIVVATLVGLGKKVDNAIKVVRSTRSGTIRNPVQIAYLKRFKKAWKKKKKIQSLNQGLKYLEDDYEMSEDEILMPAEKVEWEKYLRKIEREKVKKGKKKKKETNLEDHAPKKVKQQKHRNTFAVAAHEEDYLSDSEDQDGEPEIRIKKKKQQTNN